MSAYDGIKKGFKKIKESLTSPGMSIGLELPKDAYFAREELDGNIVVAPHEYVEIDRAVIELYCVENVKKIKRVSSGNSSYDKEYVDTAILYDRYFSYLLGCALKSGDKKITPFKIAMPITGRPTYHSVDSNVDWGLSLEVFPIGRRSLTQSYSIQVAQGSPAPIVQKEIIREIEVIYCSHCGTKNNARASNCSRCGAQLR
jgi:ribosomal protein L40E